jgi:hypothetical protein
MTPNIEFTLLLVLAAAKRDKELLLQTLREIGSACEDGKATVKHCQRLLDERGRDWLNASLKKLYREHGKNRNLPVYSYLWELSEEKPLDVVVKFRLNSDEVRELEVLAEQSGGSIHLLARKILRETLRTSCVQQG